MARLPRIGIAGVLLDISGGGRVVFGEGSRLGGGGDDARGDSIGEVAGGSGIANGSGGGTGSAVFSEIGS